MPNHTHTRTHTYRHTHIYIYTYVYVSVYYTNIYLYKYTHHIRMRGIMVNVRDCAFEGIDFGLQSRYYVPSLTNTLEKAVKPFIIINNTTAVLWQGLFWHWITQKGSYVIKQRSKMNDIFVWGCFLFFAFYSSHLKRICSFIILLVSFFF